MKLVILDTMCASQVACTLLRRSHKMQRAACARSSRAGFRRPFARDAASHTIPLALKFSVADSANAAVNLGHGSGRVKSPTFTNLQIGLPRWGQNLFRSLRGYSSSSVTAITSSDMAGSSESSGLKEGEFVGSLDCGTT